MTNEEFERQMREIRNSIRSSAPKVVMVEIVTQVVFSSSIGMFEINVN